MESIELIKECFVLFSLPLLHVGGKQEDFIVYLFTFYFTVKSFE